MKSNHIALSALSLSALMACQQLPGAAQGAATTNPSGGGGPVNLDPAMNMSDQEIISSYSDASCNSLGTGTATSNGEGGIPNYRQGLSVTVTVPPTGFNPNDSTWGDLDGFTAQNGAVQLFNPIYFTQINVPTRYFTTGFPTLSGGMIDDQNGVPLIEYFRLDMTGSIQLGDDQDEGNYEFAMLSDDGARLSFGATPTTYAEYTGVTPTRMMCGSTTVPLIHGTPLPFEMNYFQGPRYHIAAVLLMRKVDGDFQADPLCGASGNSEFSTGHKRLRLPCSLTTI